MNTLVPGDVAPQFSLPDTDGNTVALSDWLGSGVVVYFYPKDDTPGCTTEACEFNSALSEFARLGVDVLGISADDADSHRAFRDRYGLKFRLLTDGDGSVARSYGAFGERPRQDGTTYVGIFRTTCVVDADGRIRRVWYGVTPANHATEVLSELEIAAGRS